MQSDFFKVAIHNTGLFFIIVIILHFAPKFRNNKFFPVDLIKKFFFRSTMIKGCLFIFLCFLSSGCLPEKRTSQVQPLDLIHPIASLTSAALTEHPWTATAEWKPSVTPQPTQIQLTPLPTHPQFKRERIPTLRAEDTSHVVAEGDTITIIAANYQVSKNAIIEKNQIKNPDLIAVGQELVIPAQIPDFQDPGNEILPEKGILFGPSANDFNISAFLAEHPQSYLTNYIEPEPTPNPEAKKSEQQPSFKARNGAEILYQTAIQNSIDPRILIALMEFQTHSISEKKPNGNQKKSVIAHLGSYYEPLARQLAWAADTLNEGYYNWKDKKTNLWILNDDTLVAVNPKVNASTAALQYLFSKIFGAEDWLYAISKNGFSLTYQQLFGKTSDEFLSDPEFETSPKLDFPFAAGEIWSFTSGPHVGWTDGTPWSAIDFAPPDAVGCNMSQYWITASAPGIIVYSQNGLVIEDLDGDGNMGTGWILVYLHVESRDRIEINTQVDRGARIGHPSCEGGIANGSHVHLARRYNGEWIPINQDYPMILSGWEVFSTGSHYDGYLEKDGTLIEAWYFKTEASEISY
jgi:LysM repeat protein